MPKSGKKQDRNRATENSTRKLETKENDRADENSSNSISVYMQIDGNSRVCFLFPTAMESPLIYFSSDMITLTSVLNVHIVLHVSQIPRIFNASILAHLFSFYAYGNGKHAWQPVSLNL